MGQTEEIIKYGVLAYAAYYVYTNFIAPAPVVASSLPATTTGYIVPVTSTMPTVTSQPLVTSDPVPLSATGQNACAGFGGTWNSDLNICGINSLFTGTPNANSLMGKLMAAAGASPNTVMTAAQWSKYMSQVVGQSVNASGAGYTLWPSYLPGADSSTGITVAQYVQAYVSAGLPVPSGVALSGGVGRWGRRYA